MTDPGTYQYRVRAATRNGEFTPWAEVAAFTVSSADIGLDGDVDDDDQPGDADDDDQPGEGEEEVEPFFYGWGFQCDSLSDETEPLIGSFFRETEPTGETYIFCRIDGTLSVLYAVMEIAEAATEETIVSDFVTLFGEVSYDATELTLTWNRQESFTAIIGNGDLTFLNLQKLEVPAPTIYTYSVDEEKLVLNGVPFLRLDTSVQYSFELPGIRPPTLFRDSTI